MFSYYNEVRIIKYNQVKVSVFNFLPFKSYYVFIFLNNEVKAGVAVSVSASSHKTQKTEHFIYPASAVQTYFLQLCCRTFFKVW